MDGRGTGLLLRRDDATITIRNLTRTVQSHDSDLAALKTVQFNEAHLDDCVCADRLVEYDII